MELCHCKPGRLGPQRGRRIQAWAWHYQGLSQILAIWEFKHKRAPLRTVWHTCGGRQWKTNHQTQRPPDSGKSILSIWLRFIFFPNFDAFLGLDNCWRSEWADHTWGRWNIKGQKGACHTRFVYKRRRCDGVLLWVAQESEPRELRPAHIQIPKGHQLSSVGQRAGFVGETVCQTGRDHFCGAQWRV